SCYQTTVSNNKQLARRQAQSEEERINRPGGSRSKEDKQSMEKGKEKMDIQPGGEVEEIQMIEGCEERKFRIGKDLEEPIRSRLIDLVREFADIFAYTAEELTGISAEVIEHRLNIDLSVRPVKQKRRHHGAEMTKSLRRRSRSYWEQGISRKSSSLNGFEEESGGLWKLFVDGSVARSGAGLGIVLVSPKGDYLEFAAKVGFKVSNNEAEYEAVIKGLSLAKAGGARKVQVHSDSQL
ncbi:Unknown protein, partial [Striga hermonthica]